MNLVFRNYISGDEEELAHLFNESFRPMFPKDASISKWKYVEKPEFQPESLQICEDVDTNRIVGLIVSEIEIVVYQNREIKFGHINDVATSPEYQKRGISKHLMRMAMDYFEKEYVKFSCLDADPKGHPREKIYLKSGYRDVVYAQTNISLINLKTLLFHDFNPWVWLSPLIMLLPVVLLIRILRRLIESLRNVKFKKYKQFSIEITQKNANLDFFNAFNRIAPKYQDCVPKRSIKNWIWRREQVPKEIYLPTYILLKKKDKVIGGASITQRIAEIPKPRLNINLGFVQEYFMDFEEFDDEQQQNSVIHKFNSIVMQAASQCKLSALIAFTTNYDGKLNKILRKSGFFGIKSGMYMVKSHTVEEFNPNKSIFMQNNDVIGLP